MADSISLSKYYVESNEVRWVFLAKSPWIAALRAVQNSMQDSLKQNQKITTSMELLDKKRLQHLLKDLGDTITVSQIGFGRNDCGLFDTPIVVDKWREQISALESLIRRMA